MHSSWKGEALKLIEQMPCLKLNGYSRTPENDLLTRLYKPACEVRDMTHNGRGPRGVSRSVALVGRRFAGVGEVCHPKHIRRVIVEEFVRKLLIYLRRAKRWRFWPGCSLCEQRWLSYRIREQARSHTRPHFVRVCSVKCGSGLARECRQLGLSTRQHSPPTHRVMSLCTCHAYRPRYHAWCGSPGPTR